MTGAAPDAMFRDQPRSIVCGPSPQEKNTVPNMTLKTRRSLARHAAPLIICAGLMTGCAPTIDNRGFVPDPDLVAEIRVGVDNKMSVGQMLGNPTNVSTFDDDTWYYVSRRAENFAFFEENLLDQKILAISFDETGHVSEIEQHGIEEARHIDLVKRKTPTRGKKLGFFEQVLGNMGRFNKKQGQQQQQ